jgi:arginyl-tRNA synthetase
MSSSLTAEIKQRLIALSRDNFNIDPGDIVSEIPPRTELGDLAFPIAFDLAKRIKAATGEKKNPRELATKLAEGLTAMPGVARVEVAGAGYLNVFLDRAKIFAQLINEGPQSRGPESQSGKLIVEHTSINPNKAAHIGHVRNAVLGDTTVRILRATGENVEVHNYIDNTGVQVADVVVGFLHLENKSIDEIRALAERPVTKRRRASITIAGICIRASAHGTRRTNRGWRSAPGRSTKSKRAATGRPRPPNTFHRRSSISTWTRWRGSTSATTCWRARRRF